MFLLSVSTAEDWQFVEMTTGTPVVTTRSVTPPVPAGTEPLQHQVAGHVFGRPNGQNRNKIGQILALSLFE